MAGPSRALPLLLVVLLVGCFSSTLTIEQVADFDGEPDREFEVPSDGFVTDPLPPDLNDPGDLPLTLTRVKPNAASASGGASVTVVGSAFSAKARVFFGDSPVEQVDTKVDSANEIEVVVPPGSIGPVDVTVELASGETVSLKDGFTYHGIDIAPSSGPLAGGTLVEVTVAGRELEDGIELQFAGAPCTDLTVVTPRRMRCKTPSGMQGPADLRLVFPDGEEALAPSAFEYVGIADAINGGLSGGPIDGVINVTVVDSAMQLPLPGAWVVVGDDPDGALKGQTNARGQISLSAPDLTGPVTVHVAFDCFESTSFVAVDAQNVVAILDPAITLRCLDELDIDSGEFDNFGDGGGGGGGTVGIAGSRVSGELRFRGPEEFGAGDWRAIPEPRPGEVRVLYVYTTVSSVFSSSVDPARGDDSIQRIEEGAEKGPGGGFPYRIFTRPAGMAVYALGGLEDPTTGKFVPYVMGVERNVVTAPGVDTSGVDIDVSLTLDQALSVRLQNLPSAGLDGPLEYRVSTALDLGAEGFIVRAIRGRRLDVRSSTTGAEPFDFYGQPPLSGPLSDARYSVLAGWYSGDYNSYPYTEALVEGVLPQGGEYTVDSLLGIPKAVAPAPGAPMPADRVLRWSADGAEPDFYYIQVTLSDRTPVWRYMVRGDVRQVAMPDLSGLEGLNAVPDGFLTWEVRGLRVRGFDWNRFTFSYLRSRNWTHDAVDSFLFQVR